MDETDGWFQPLVWVAQHHHGLITRAAHLAARISDERMESLAAAGIVARKAHGVYVVNGMPPTWRQDALAACLARPEGAVVSHLSAAALYELWKPPPVPHITVPQGRSPRTRLAIVHRANLGPADITRVAGIPATTTIPRTLVDCAALLPRSDLGAMVDDGLCRRGSEANYVLEAIERASRRPGRAGIPLLRSVLEPWLEGPKPGSPAEMRLLRRLEEWGFRRPERQVEVYDETGRLIAVIDLGWRPELVGVEYDGERAHTPRRLLPDEERHARLKAFGWYIARADKTDVRPSATRLRSELWPVLMARRAA